MCGLTECSEHGFDPFSVMWITEAILIPHFLRTSSNITRYLLAALYRGVYVYKTVSQGLPLSQLGRPNCPMGVFRLQTWSQG